MLRLRPLFSRTSGNTGLTLPGLLSERRVVAGFSSSSAGGVPVEIGESLWKRLDTVVSNDNPGKDEAHRYLRVTVEGGGCSGFSYSFALSSDAIDPESDLVVKGPTGAQSGRDLAVVIDKTSLPFLEGSTLDWVSELVGSTFQVTTNPNAESGCGCGVSFSPKF